MHRLGRIAITSTLLALSLHPGLARAGTAGGFVYSHYEGLSYVANAGETNDVTITGSGSTYSIHDSAGLTAGLDCTQVDATTATCESSRPSFHDISVATRDGDDIVHISSDTNTHVLGGRGDDQLFGGSESAEHSAGDVLDGGPGGDTLGGAPGVRTFVLYSSRTAPVRVSTDGVANDGERGEGDNVLPSIYGVTGSPAGDHFVGSAGEDFFAGFDGNDSISGLGGSDSLYGGEGNPGCTGPWPGSETCWTTTRSACWRGRRRTMGEHGYDDLARDLAALGRAVDVPVPGASLAVSVLERLPRRPLRKRSRERDADASPWRWPWRLDSSRC